MTIIKLIKCSECKNIATWFYPSDYSDDGGGYCDECVPRDGCSCYMDEDGNYEVDERGRNYPCVDYMWFEKGVECEEDELGIWDEYDDY